LKDEIFHLQENSSDVSEYPPQMGKDRALVNMSHDGKHLVQVDAEVDLTDVRSGTCVALKRSSPVLNCFSNSAGEILVTHSIQAH
jgi:ATP-dependent 26S proteasome regulatory subunit